MSRATVYNTLNLLVEKGLLRTQLVKEETVDFDPDVKKRHHLIDDETGDIHDIPWEHLEVKAKEKLRGFEVLEYQVIIHDRRRKKK